LQEGKTPGVAKPNKPGLEGGSPNLVGRLQDFAAMRDLFASGE